MQYLGAIRNVTKNAEHGDHALSSGRFGNDLDRHHPVYFSEQQFNPAGLGLVGFNGSAQKDVTVELVCGERNDCGLDALSQSSA
jgi:hypothetical protein